MLGGELISWLPYSKRIRSILNRIGGNADKNYNAHTSSVFYEMNLRLTLSAYHLGTGASDLSKPFMMLGFGNVLSFGRSFTRQTRDMC